MTELKSKKFNISGPRDPTLHYMLPAVPRLQGVRDLIKSGLFFVIHALRQSGKTTSVKAYADHLNEEGGCHAMYHSLETIRGVADVSETMDAIVRGFIVSLKISNVEDLENIADSVWNELKETCYYSSFPVLTCLSALCGRLDKELVLFFDDVDALEGETFIQFFSQLRVGYVERSFSPFPLSIAIVGVRDIKARLIEKSPDSGISSASGLLNMLAKSLRLQDFTPADIASLYAQHAKATG
ncbi:MAG: hypothetical protein LBR53_13660 [Deltaproteobacteria bacterium]|jgi:hypothetical protein|nr:hypothetical protein [Deltaproteobacteria bacterium]